VAELGRRAVRDADPVLTVEDFAHYLRRVPGTLFRLGVRPVGRRRMPPLHHPAFLPDDRAIEIGSRVLARIAYDAVTAAAGAGSAQTNT